MPGELVLRGGFLKDAILLTSLITEGTSQFWPLWKVCPILNKFLTPLSSCKRPLAECGTLERLTALRNQQIEKETEAQAAKDATKEPRESDPIAGLGLDAPRAKRARPRARTPRRTLQQDLPQLPAVTTLEVPMPAGATWRPRVLLGSDQKKALAMEATSENLSNLLELVQHDSEGDTRRQRPPRNSANVRAGPPNCRDYYRGLDRWLRRQRTNEPGARPYSRRYLARLVTTAGAPVPRKTRAPVPRKTRARRSGRKLSEVDQEEAALPSTFSFLLGRRSKGADHEDALG